MTTFADNKSVKCIFSSGHLNFCFVFESYEVHLEEIYMSKLWQWKCSNFNVNTQIIPFSFKMKKLFGHSLSYFFFQKKKEGMHIRCYQKFIFHHEEILGIESRARQTFPMKKIWQCEWYDDICKD